MFGKLTDMMVRNARPRAKQYYLTDGSRLELVVFPTDSKTWRLSYTSPVNGKRKTISLGEYPSITLRDAREKAALIKKKITDGIDPVAERKQAKARAEEKQETESRTLERVAREWFGRFSGDWTSGHSGKILRRMESYLFPILGSRQISELKPTDLLPCVRPLEESGKIETAYRLLRTASQIFRFATLNGWTERDVTSELRGALPPVKKKHLGALVKPDAIRSLLLSIDQFQGRNESVKNCLKLAPHIFLRPGEIRQIRKDWVDLEKMELTIPAQTMKGKVEHIVPLSKQSADIIKNAMTGNQTEFLFPSPTDRTRSISNMAMLTAIRRMGYSPEEMSAHGFRALASTNLEQLGFDIRTIEIQLAHVDPNMVRAAYKRDTTRLQIVQRRQMMQKWSNWLDHLKS
jgi:integrase